MTLHPLFKLCLAFGLVTEPLRLLRSNKDSQPCCLLASALVAWGVFVLYCLRLSEDKVGDTP